MEISKLRRVSICKPITPLTRKRSKMVAKSWLTVPDSIKVVFDKFPLQVNPPAALPKSVVSELNQDVAPPKPGTRSLTLYVYNLNPSDGLPTDPESLEILALLRLKNLHNNVQIKVVSPHSAPLANGATHSKLPYLIDVSKNGKKTIYSSVSSVRSNLLLQSKGLPVMYQSLITFTLRDAWLVTVLLDSELRQLVFGEGPHRIQAVPPIVEQFLQDLWTSRVIEELRPRYPAIVDSFVNSSAIGGGLYHLIKNQWKEQSSPIVSFFNDTKQGQAILEEIYARAEKSFSVFEALLTTKDYLGTGDESPETQEDVSDNGHGPLDILLSSYVYNIQNCQSSQTQLSSILSEFPRVLEHSQRVHSQVFP